MSVGVMASAVVVATETFPALATVNTETGTSLGTNNAIPSPSGVVAGNLLLASASHDAATVITASTGWTEIIATIVGSNHRAAVFARIADGSANDTLSLSGTTQEYCASILRVTGHGVTNVATDIKKASTTGTASVPDPPSLDAGSSRKWLWVAVVGVSENTAGQVLGAPTGYTLAHSNLSAGTAGTGLGVATKTAEVQTDNPSTWGTSAARPWHGYTLAIPPSSGGPVTLYSDDFNRADGAPGANWVQASGSAYTIASNKLTSTTGVDHADWVSAMPSADHWVEADVTGISSGEAYVVIHARGSGVKSNFYMGFLVPGNGLTIGKNVSGVYSDVSNIAFAHGTAHKLRLEVQGSTQRLYVDGVLQLTTNDTSLSSGTAVGINSNGSPGAYDNWAAGTL